MFVETNPDDFKPLLNLLHEAYGYDFTGYADASIRRRSMHFMTTHRITSVAELQKILLSNEKIFEEFVQNISVTVTEMFRDPLFYQSLRQRVCPRLATYPVIKIWIAGCATGEEAYSVAILLKEEGLLSRSVIYATDINQHSVNLAKDGVFPMDNMKNYTQNYQKSGGTKSFSEYYIANYNHAIFDRSLKKNMVFAPHNLATDQSFNEFQLILCRNVLIYFNQELQNKVINLFYDSLCTFGFLGLGNKESLLFTDKKSCFEMLDKKEKIFMKTR
ncbi:MAG TPA: protein-glutamate O-methyltransferase CheR [Ohtaekwangia sp.]|nr:protein-glutamate O-methyltransferase CheR [Ohtaekwangia sp.]